MSQADSQIGTNPTGLAYRTADNAGKKAILNHHKGGSAPTYAEAGILWINDTSTPWTVQFYDGTDWITMGEINSTNNTFNPYLGTTALAGRLVPYATDTGAANAYAVAPSPAVTAYTAGMIVTLKPANPTTAASTINVNSLGNKNIKLLDGSNPSTGTMITTGIYFLFYDGTNFIILNSATASSFGNASADSGTANHYILSPNPAPTAYTNGLAVVMNPAHPNTGACDINISSLGIKNIKLLDGTNPAANAMTTTGEYLLVYNGTNMVLCNPNLGTAAYQNTGSGAGQIPVRDANGNIGKLIGRACHRQTAFVGSATFPSSTTAPAITNGKETNTLTYTATDAANILRFTFVGTVTGGNPNYSVGAVLFDSVSGSALAGSIVNSNYGSQPNIIYEQVAGDTSAHTYSIRIGGFSQNASVNAASGTWPHGVTLVIEEFTP